MAITNGYLTLNEAKQWLVNMALYTATTLSFTSGTKTIADSAKGLRRFATGTTIQITGSVSNNGIFTVVTGDTVGSIVVSETVTTEVAGASITIADVVSYQHAQDPINDPLIEDIVEAASRHIDAMTGRTFFSATETRSFVVGEDTDGLMLYLDKPLLTVTTLTNGDDNVVATTDYVKLPINGAWFDRIKLTADSGTTWNYVTDPHVDLITIAGAWGKTSAAPENIKQACRLIANRMWKRKDIIFGVAGATAVGQIEMTIPDDPDVRKLLDPYSKNFVPMSYGRGK